MLLFPPAGLVKKPSLPKGLAEPAKMDMERFKVVECHIKTYHDHKQCPLYHSLKDKRRDLRKINYKPELCPFITGNTCSKGNSCNFSHNTVEQFYHPKKYKTKFCTHYGENIKDCCYGSFCSFAHHMDELKIERLHLQPKNMDFFVHQYKTVYCPFNHQHDKSGCEYSHNVQDFRRHPLKHKYKPEICKKWNVSSEISSY